MKIAALLNGRAKRVTPRVERDLRRALPDALVLVSHDFDEASAHADRIAADRPDVVLSGGGDGAAVKLLNLLRERGPLPIVGVLKLGTGNGWARVSGAPEFRAGLPLRRRRLGRAYPE
jgi:diacylglycerol kinase family enzyme